MPDFQVRVASSALRESKRLSVESRKRIAAVIVALGDNPRPPGCKKLVNSDIWRVRVGDYRVLYAVNDGDQTIEIRAVRHRSEAYSR